MANCCRNEPLSRVCSRLPFILLPNLSRIRCSERSAQLNSCMVIRYLRLLCRNTLGKDEDLKKFSPNKSLEGMIGGFLGAMVFSFAYKFIFGTIFKARVMPFSSLVIFSVIVTVFDTFGDLFESALKRYFKVKDTGNVLPGHGGMLDRIDGLLFVTPVTYYLLSIGVL